MNRFLDNLLIFTAIAIISTVAVILAFRYGDYQGRRAAYEIQLAQCKTRYAEYRCRIDLSRFYDIHKGEQE